MAEELEAPMSDEITATEVDQVLRRQRIGRIGSTSVGHVEITPIIYGYDGTNIYGHSRFGRKIQYMRGNPEVCFEVEEIADPTSWRVVVLRGTYEDLTDPQERDKALRLILAQAGGGPESAAVRAERGDELVIYAIRIEQRSGRCEAPLANQVGSA
jgi:nitroimidazol reductase NimA-like FMN-containing flavoprotein (pyridoxamine 5'-phosphate oxidase superfamily)